MGDGESGDYYELEGSYDPERLESFLSFLDTLDYDLALPGHQMPWTKAEQREVLEGMKS